MSTRIFHKLVLLFIVLSICTSLPQQIVLDEMENTDNWKFIRSDGVEADISTVDGVSNKAIKFDYNFIHGTGYCGIQKQLSLSLPANYEFSFFIKAESPDNNFEFKLIDASGTNVWWCNNRNYKFPTEWTKVKIKQRQINFAWGSSQEYKPSKIERIEFTIASVNGGKGSIYIDDFRFEEKPVTSEDLALPLASSTSFLAEQHNADLIFDSDFNTQWISSGKNKSEEIVIDLLGDKEFGGLIITWDKEKFAKQFEVLSSFDKTNWNSLYKVTSGKSGKSFIPLKDAEGRFLKLKLIQSNHKNIFAINELEIKHVNFTQRMNYVFETIASSYPRGFFPRYLQKEASFFTVCGVDKDSKEALINEEGMVEVDKLNFSLEPFLYLNDKFITWNDVEISQSLEDNYLPIPSVNRKSNDVELDTKIFTDGEPGNSNLNFMYEIKNVSDKNQGGNFYVAIRPFQVNPSYMDLNIVGGATNVNSIQYNNDNVLVNDNKIVIPITKPDGFGAAEFDEGDITEFISQDILPGNNSVKDHVGYASGSLKYSFNLKPGEIKKVFIVVPFHNIKNEFEKFENSSTAEKYFADKLEKNKNYWQQKLNYTKFNLPESADKLVNTFKSNLAYILVNKDGVATQPGSRCYERSWIRDGAISASAMLKFGMIKEATDYLDWYSQYQYPNGKIPCVVDTRGPDPVPEHDSNGEYIYLVYEIYKFTKDTAYLRSKFQNVVNAVGYINSLIAERSTDEYRNVDSLTHFYGLLTESISHEGYSAKPMHSYWDDFWAMKGFKDAVDIAAILDENDHVTKFTKERDEFRKNFYNSIELSTKKHNINYIPGCADLGDFDATSTTIALFPCGEYEYLPKDKLKNTFDRYIKHFTTRRDSVGLNWTNYTPYEIRAAGSFIFMNQPERTKELLDYFFKDHHPYKWNHWAEVVWQDYRLPRYVGDMPHTWIASDFINVIRSIFCYEDENLNALILGAGLYPEWIDSPTGMSVENLPTYYGDLSYSIKKSGNQYAINLSGNIDLPDGKIILKNFNESKFPKSVTVNGNVSTEFTESEIKINEFPAAVVVTY